MAGFRSLLIVDDHVFVLQGMKMTVEAAGMFEEIVLAHNAEEALELAESARPQTAIVDISLPDMDGIKLTRELRKRCPDTKILIVSMHNRYDYIVESFRAGARGYTVKESSAENFLEALRCVAQGNYFVDGSLGFDLGSVLADTATGPSVRNAAYSSLSQREQQVMRLIAEGFSSKEIGDKLGISYKTVDVHRASILKKLNLDNGVEVVRFAASIGLIDIPRADATA